MTTDKIHLLYYKHLLILNIIYLIIGCTSISDTSDIDQERGYKSYQLDENGNLIYSEMNHSDFQLPDDCADCHPEHIQEWTNSGHARSITNPLFEEFKAKTFAHFGSTGEKFCFQCHDPVNVIASYDSFESNIYSHGVSCDVCHTMTQLSNGVNTNPSSYVTAEYFLNPGEGIKYGPLEHPDSNAYHKSIYSPLFTQSEICLPCHNLTIDNVEAEITYSEWNRIPEFAMSGAFSCQDCHMPLKENGMHDHGFAGVDVDLSKPAEDSPQFEKVSEMLNSSALLSFDDEHGSLDNGIDIEYQHQFSVKITSLTGHSLPSGTSFNREVWLEILILDFDNWLDTLFMSGIIDYEQQKLDYSDSNLVYFTSWLIDENGDTTSEVIKTKEILNYSLPGLATRKAIFNFPDEIIHCNQILIKARLLFRPVKPYLLYSRPDLLENLPVFVIDEIEKLVNIL